MMNVGNVVRVVIVAALSLLLAGCAARDGSSTATALAGEDAEKGEPFRQVKVAAISYTPETFDLAKNADTLERLVRALKTFAVADVRRDGPSSLPLELALVESSLDEAVGAKQAIVEPATPEPDRAPAAEAHAVPPSVPAEKPVPGTSQVRESAASAPSVGTRQRRSRFSYRTKIIFCSKRNWF